MHQIGVGALGPVFRTYEPERDRLVAVKAFRIDLTPEQARAFADELSRAAAAGLFHPSIVEPIAAGVEGSLAYGAEEYVAAESLDVAMRDYMPASIETLLPFITQLAGAIDFARAVGVGHGALHPRDIFMTADEARATGFGVVEALERVGFRAPVRRPYSPPERIAGQAWNTTADVFSLAAVTYELLTGRRPSGLGAEIGPLTAGTPSPWMDGLHRVLAQAMAAEPAERFPTALGFAAALETAVRGAETASAAGLDPFAAPALDPIAASAVGEGWPLAMAAPGDQSGDPDPALHDSSEALDSCGPADVDDIETEREGDEAYQDLLHDQSAQSAATEQQAPLLLDPDSEAEVEADRFMIDVAAAASASASDRTADVLHRAGNDSISGSGLPGRALDTSPDVSPDVAARDRVAPLPAVAHSSYPLPVRRDSRLPVALPLVLTLLAGLVGGFGVGYLLWGRPSESVATADAAPGRDGPAADSPAATRGTRSAPAATVPPPPAATPDSTTTRAATDPRPAAADPRPPAALPSAGRLIVRSTPSGAGVLLNGRWRGRTPLTLDKLPFTRYSLRVTQPGFLASTEAITLAASDPVRELTVRLRPQPGRAASAGRSARSSDSEDDPRGQSTFSGSVYVDSRPRGARVSIDGKPVGVTPLRVADVRIGTRIVRLELPTYRIWSSTARVAAGQEAKITGSLERIQ